MRLTPVNFQHEKMEPQRRKVQTSGSECCRGSSLQGCIAVLCSWGCWCGSSQPSGWFGFLGVLWLQHCWDCSLQWPGAEVAPALDPLCLLGLLDSLAGVTCSVGRRQSPCLGSDPRAGGLSDPLGSLLFSRLISLGFDEESVILSMISLEQPRETPTSSLSFLCGWPSYGCGICPAGRAFAANKHHVFYSLAPSFFPTQ